MTAIRKHAKAFVAVLGLIVVSAGVSLYILDQQRMRFPWEAAPLRLKAEFATAQAVTPGQGQTVRVSGVRIGDIGEVELEDGKAVVELVIDPEYKGMVRTDATALLRPKTGLKDMFIDLEPGTSEAPAADEAFTIPIASTAPDVNPDEILAELDADTRDYLKLLIGDAGRGLEGRGLDLREVFRRFEPTHRDLARVNSAVATRRSNLRHLITSLNTLNGELASRGDDLAGLVDSSAAVMHAFASEEANVSAAVGELPARAAADDRHDGQARGLRQAARPDRRAPAPRRARAGARQRRAAPAGARGGAAAARRHPPVRARGAPGRARPAARRQEPRQGHAGPHHVVRALNHFLNLAANNPNGREDPDDPNRQEGYLFWVAWVQHMATQLFSSSDAHGTFRPVTVAAPCATIEQLVNERAGARVPLHAHPDPHRHPGLRDRLMNKSAPSLSRILTMVMFALSCFGLLLFLWLSFGGAVPLKPQGYRVQVAFPEATTLATEADVRIAGVSVGKVRELEVDGDRNRTLATIELDRQFAPLHADARAMLRQKTLLGETYVELTPGRSRAMLARGRAAGERPGGRHRAARRDLRRARPGHAQGLPRPGSRSSARGSRAAGATSTTRSARCRASPPTAPTCCRCSTRRRRRCSAWSRTPASRSAR